MYVFIIIRENAISKKLKTEIMREKNLRARKKTAFWMVQAVLCMKLLPSF